MSYTPTSLPHYAHFLSGYLPRAGWNLNTSIPMDFVRTGRVDVKPSVQQHLESMVSSSTLQPYLEVRRRFSREGLVRELEDINLAVRVGLDVYADSLIPAEHDVAPLAITGIGRYYSILESLRRRHQLSSPTIAQMGVGLDPYQLMFAAESFIKGDFENLGLQAMGISPETFELASIGPVVAYDWDPKVIQNLRLNMREGIFYDQLRPARYWNNRVFSSTGTGIADSAGRLFDEWENYLAIFFRRAGTMHHPIKLKYDGQDVVFGGFGTFQPWILNHIQPEIFDVVTEGFWSGKTPKSFGPPFDIVWAVGCLLYLPGSLQLTAMVKLVDIMKMGGTIFVERLIAPPQFEKSLFEQDAFEQFMTLLGLRIDLELSRPFELGRTIVLAVREEKTPWLEERLSILKQLGIA